MDSAAFEIATITLNPAIDHTLAILHFTAGAVNRVERSQLDAGGKGVNVAAALADYGVSVAVTGFLGKENDDIFVRLFAAKGITDRFIRIAGATRTGHQGHRPGQAPDHRHQFPRPDACASGHRPAVRHGGRPRRQL
jgi:1-phosphofructokinase